MEKEQTFDIEIDGILTTAELLDIIDYKDASYAVYSVEINEEILNLMFTKENGLYTGTDLIRYPFKIIRKELGILVDFMICVEAMLQRF